MGEPCADPAPGEAGLAIAAAAAEAESPPTGEPAADDADALDGATLPFPFEGSPCEVAGGVNKCACCCCC